ncbi:MAG: HAD family phosphatase [Pseudorhodobacter sp.]|nr:HAD family phosphatase [Rhizobacter sp.]
MTPPSNGHALLFDLDGTLIDSMPAHEQAWITWHRRHGIAMDSAGFFASTAGRTNDEILYAMLPGRTEAEYTSWVDEKESLYRELAANSLSLIKGAHDYLLAARASGFSLAICTASTPKNMVLAFEKFGIDKMVDTITSPSDGLRGKPHPDIFLEAARRLKIPPERCVVFEDAPLGIEAAHRAGMKAVALTTTLPAAAFASFDNLICIAADFSAVNPPDTFATQLC